MSYLHEKNAWRNLNGQNPSGQNINCFLTSSSRVESRLSFVSIDKTTFWTPRPNIGSAAYMEDSFPHRAYFRQTTGRNPCLWTCPTTTDLSFISKTQVLGKGPKCVLSCTIPTLNHHLSNGIAEDQLLFPIWAIRFYLERSMPWREHKHLLFTSFKPGHKRDIVPSTISGWIQKTILENYTNSPTPVLESHKVKAHQGTIHGCIARIPQTGLHLRADTWSCHNTFTDFYLKTYLSILPISFN